MFWPGWSNPQDHMAHAHKVKKKVHSGKRSAEKLLVG